MSAENCSNTSLLEMIEREKAKIEGALERVHLERVSEYEKRRVPLTFSRELMALSEMQLCRAVYEQEIRAYFKELGYRAVMGFAQVYDAEGVLQLSRYHCFYFNPQLSYVACLTAGQLQCNGGVPSHKGAVLEKLQGEAPEHIVKLSDEVVVLYGTDDDVERELRYKYIPIWGRDEE